MEVEAWRDEESLQKSRGSSALWELKQILF